MLQLSNSITNIPIMSLRTGGVVATAKQLIINPNNLKIEGWYCEDKFSKRSLVLLAKDVRDIVPQGLAIDDHERLSEASELVRLHDVLELNFGLIGKPVITESKRKVGKVSDYSADMSTLYVVKLYISQPVYRNFSGGQLSIDRSQIVEITSSQITVRDVDIKVGAAIPLLSPI
jgi:sporulation protein YlmC with PRC-barrel domain